MSGQPPPHHFYGYYDQPYSVYDGPYSAKGGSYLGRTPAFVSAPVVDDTFVHSQDTGSSVGVHPILQPGPRQGVTSVAILFDIQKSPNYAELLIGPTSKRHMTERDRGAPATRERSSRMRLVFELPWSSCDVEKPSGIPVTVEDVLDAVYNTLRTPLTEPEVFLSGLDARIRRHVRQARGERCNSQGLSFDVEPMRRIDWAEKKWFGGLSKDMQSVRSVLGSTKSKEIKDTYLVILQSGPTNDL